MKILRLLSDTILALVGKSALYTALAGTFVS